MPRTNPCIITTTKRQKNRNCLQPCGRKLRATRTRPEFGVFFLAARLTRSNLAASAVLVRKYFTTSRTMFLTPGLFFLDFSHFKDHILLISYFFYFNIYLLNFFFLFSFKVCKRKIFVTFQTTFLTPKLFFLDSSHLQDDILLISYFFHLIYYLLFLQCFQLKLPYDLINLIINARVILFRLLTFRR
ncbi:hypothetical protein RHMOL_Rhmol07G0208200 [Rhododendron molle]|uniref:Uncharacterized protein n=1 Tax=Rhododendron molle TaxID=49168 RepID=A0ACC0N4V5_RHOML|nr:hypothetical protein RHMOL_Rhmol07G0208200 [Rhododendron molle]